MDVVLCDVVFGVVSGSSRNGSSSGGSNNSSSCSSVSSGSFLCSSGSSRGGVCSGGVCLISSGCLVGSGFGSLLMLLMLMFN